MSKTKRFQGDNDESFSDELAEIERSFDPEPIEAEDDAPDFDGDEEDSGDDCDYGDEDRGSDDLSDDGDALASAGMGTDEDYGLFDSYDD